MSIGLEDLRQVAEIEFDQIVLSTETLGEKLRIFLSDGTFYRYDNFPNTAWRSVTSYPMHFHDGSQNRVVPAPFSEALPDGFRDFMRMVQGRVQAT